MSVYKAFSDSVIDLMKSNTEQAVSQLTSLVESSSTMSSSTSAAAQQSQASSSHQQSCIQSDGTVRGYLKPLVYLYRAYGYVHLEKYEKALKDYIKASHVKNQSSSASYKLNKENSASNNVVDDQQHYNKIIVQGILALLRGEFEIAVNFFNKAH